MAERKITTEALHAYARELCEEEKSAATLEKYLRDIRAFWTYAGTREITKELLMEYKNSLVRRGYAVRSVNSMLASIGGFLRFMGWEDCRVKHLKLQQSAYCAESKELTKAEYLRLLEASRSRPRLHLLLQTICGTGIRVSELKYFTVEAVKGGEVRVTAKGKTRTILIAGKLKKLLLGYAREQGIRSGIIFRTKSGRPLNRSNIWAEMKSLCRAANVSQGKVFPHNLRKLFARCFYAIDKDIAKLADLLGHSNINTTRIYIISTGAEHRRKLERLGLVV